MSDEQIQTALDKAKASNVQIIDTGVIGISSKEEEARKLFDWAKKVGITTIISEPDANALPISNLNPTDTRRALHGARCSSLHSRQGVKREAVRSPLQDGYDGCRCTAPA